MSKVYPNVASKIARQPGVKLAVRAERDRLAVIARGLFASHDNPGGHKITTTNSRKTDAFINLEGPAALSLEVGHFAAQGPDGGIPNFVEGIHVLGRTVAQGRL